MKTIIKRVILVIAVFCLLFLIFGSTLRERYVGFYVKGHIDELNAYIAAINDEANEKNHWRNLQGGWRMYTSEYKNGWEVIVLVHEGGSQCVSFNAFSIGIAPSGSEEGVFYASDDNAFNMRTNYSNFPITHTQEIEDHWFFFREEY